MSGETAIEERPGAVEWASLKPGDLAWDAGDGDLVVAWRDDKEVGGYAPLLLVHPGGRIPHDSPEAVARIAAAQADAAREVTRQLGLGKESRR